MKSRDCGRCGVAELNFDDVRRRWLAAGGKNTGGIIEWFGPPTTTRWVESTISAEEVGGLRFIGTDARGMWDGPTGGTHRVGDFQPSEATPGFAWDLSWELFAVRDPENDERVLIDGNERARELHLAVSAGTIPPDRPIRLITGDLNLGVVRIAKAVAPLWR